jgi:hypothetical protein
MIRVEDLHVDQLALVNLQWVDLHDIYDDIAEGSGTVLCYDRRYGLDPLVILELERLINEGGSRDEILLFLHEFADDCNGEGWLDDVGDDLHESGQLRTGDDHGMAGD